MAEIVVNAKALDELAGEFEKVKRQLIGRLAERGYQLLREEVPYKTGNLKQGVAAPDVDYEKLTAVLTVSARSARAAGGPAILIGADGQKKKTVTLKPSNAFNYAEAVARGRAAIKAKNGKVLIIPVASAPSGESYLLAGSQIFVFRRSAKATKPNPFDERTVTRLEGEAPKIGDAVMSKFFN